MSRHLRSDKGGPHTAAIAVGFCAGPDPGVRRLDYSVKFDLGRRYRSAVGDQTEGGRHRDPARIVTGCMTSHAIGEKQHRSGFGDLTIREREAGESILLPLP